MDKRTLLWTNRRSFLKTALIGTAAVSFPGLVTFPRLGSSQNTEEFYPIGNILDPTSPKHFGGDDPMRAHRILWDKANYLAGKGGIPKAIESVPLIIVGGGIAGLSAAFSLRDLKPILLEQAPQFGGLAKGEQWGDLIYSVGSAYMTLPEEGSATHTLLKDLDLLKKLRVEGPDVSGVLYQEKFFNSFWEGNTDPAHASEFLRVKNALFEVAENGYPDIPLEPSSQLSQAQLFALDRLSFSEWVSANLGAIHPHIEEFFHEYCWDAFGGTYQEISAAQALNFLAADMQGMAALPGGNSAVADALCRKLEKDLPPQHLRPGCFVIDIAVNAEGVNVCYEDPSGKLQSVQTKACLVSSPKYVARAMVAGLPADQDVAMSKIEYRAGLVANFLVQGRIATPTYGVFKLKGVVPGDVEVELHERGFSSWVFGSWASSDQSDHSVLTLYKGFPYSTGRKELLKPGSFEKEKNRFEKILPSLLAAIHVSQERIQGLRITRWGHALPLARKGLIAEGSLPIASRPIANRIFFGQQDNWANPCMESAIKAAVLAATKTRESLRTA